MVSLVFIKSPSLKCQGMGADLVLRGRLLSNMQSLPLLAPWRCGGGGWVWRAPGTACVVALVPGVSVLHYGSSCLVCVGLALDIE